MNVASLELCKELYELSGWDGTAYYWQLDYYEDGSSLWNLYHENEAKPRTGRVRPAYDTDFILANLPQFELRKTSNGYAIRVNTGSASVSAAYRNSLRKEADKPANAACNLAIELFKQGILTKEEA